MCRSLVIRPFAAIVESNESKNGFREMAETLAQLNQLEYTSAKLDWAYGEWCLRDVLAFLGRINTVRWIYCLIRHQYSKTINRETSRRW